MAPPGGPSGPRPVFRQPVVEQGVAIHQSLAIGNGSGHEEIIPVFFNLMAGLTSLTDLRTVGRLAAKTLTWFLATSVVKHLNLYWMDPFRHRLRISCFTPLLTAVICCRRKCVKIWILTPSCGNPATLISVVQGNGAASPLVGQVVTVEGIVVGDFQDETPEPPNELNGFFLQEEDADGDVKAIVYLKDMD